MTKLARVFLVLINIICFVFGAVMFGIAIWVLIDQDSFINLAKDASLSLRPNNLARTADDANVGNISNISSSTISIIAIVAGGLLMILSFLGCCGSVVESKCLLKGYILLLVIIVLLQSVGLILVTMYRDEWNTNIEGFLRESFKQYEIDDPDDRITKTWNAGMEIFTCCGVNGYQDFHAAIQLANNNSIPNSCCPELYVSNKTAACTYEKAQDEEVEGCFDEAIRFMDNNSSIIIGIGAAVIVIELLGLYCAFILHNSIGLKKVKLGEAVNAQTSGQTDEWRRKSSRQIATEMKTSKLRSSKLGGNASDVERSNQTPSTTDKYKPSAPPASEAELGKAEPRLNPGRAHPLVDVESHFEFPPPPNFGTKKETYETE